MIPYHTVSYRIIPCHILSINKSYSTPYDTIVLHRIQFTVHLLPYTVCHIPYKTDVTLYSTVLFLFTTSNKSFINHMFIPFNRKIIIVMNIHFHLTNSYFRCYFIICFYFLCLSFFLPYYFLHYSHINLFFNYLSYRWDPEELQVRGSTVSGEITAIFSREDTKIELRIRLPPTYPLCNVEVRNIIPDDVHTVYG